MGEAKRRAVMKARGSSNAFSPVSPPMPIGPLVLQSFAGTVQVKWDTTAAVTPMGQLSFFIEFLKVSGEFDALVASCPLDYHSPNASTRQSGSDVLDGAALSFYEKLQFSPAHMDADPVETTIKLPVNFRLESNPSSK